MDSAGTLASRLSGHALDHLSRCPSNPLNEFLIPLEACRQERVKRGPDRRYQLLSLGPKQHTQCLHHTHAQTHCRAPSRSLDTKPTACAERDVLLPGLVLAADTE